LSRVLLVPEPGQLVDVRHRRYVVVEVTPSTLPLPVLHSGTLARQHLVTLSSVEDDALGEDLQVIWEVEPGRRRLRRLPCLSPLASMRRNAWIPSSTRYAGARPPARM
jgi:hypothetical protein